MRTFATYLLMLLMTPLVGACDNGSGPDPTEVCPAICQKEADCDLLGNQTYDDCVAECLSFANNMLDSYLEAYAECTEAKTCAELEQGVVAQGLCYEENVDLCTTNTDDWVEQA